MVRTFTPASSFCTPRVTIWSPWPMPEVTSAASSVNEATVTGLEGTTYLDKVDNFQAKPQQGAVTFTGPTDRVYLNTSATCVIHDAAGKRSVTVAKTGSNTTVVWNPWESGAAKLPDIEASEWHEFLCVETVNAAANSVTLAPGASHSMQAHVSVEDVKA